MAFRVTRFDPQSAAEKAVSAIGFGYDLSTDIRLSGCKPGPSGSGLIEVNRTRTKDLVLPGGVVVPNVSASIKCGKGERTRFRSDVLSFNQVIFFLLGSGFWFVICLSGEKTWESGGKLGFWLIVKCLYDDLVV